MISSLNAKLGFSLIILLSISACAFQQGDGAPTLSDLYDRPIPIIDEQPMAKSLELAEQSYRQMLDLDTESEMRPEALRRLADIVSDVDNIMNDNDEVDQEALTAATELYQEALDDYPKYRSRDHILYQLARIQDQNGKPDESFLLLEELITKHPDSRFFQEAQFRRAEYLFIEREYRQAQTAYAAVIAADGDKKFIEPAIYKKGWSLFKQNEYELAVNEFTSILDDRVVEGARDLEKLSRTERDRIDDSLRGISLSFVYQEGADSALDYFDKNGARKYEDLVYTHLAEYYIDKERYTDGAQTFAGFLERNPWHENAADFQARVIGTLRKGDFPSLELEARKEFVARFDVDSEYWEYYPVADNQHIVDEVKINVVDLANHYQSLAQVDNKNENYLEAEVWYKRFLSSFPKDEKAPEINYLLAESYYQNGRFRDSAKAYEAVAYDYQSHPKSAEAGYAALLAYQQAIDNKTAQEAATASNEFTDSAVQFEKAFPEHPQANQVLVSVAQNQFDQRDYDKAMAMAERLIKKQPPTGDAEKGVAWTILANSNFEQDDFAAAENAYIKALALVPASDGLSAGLTENLSIAVYRQAEAAKAKGDTAGAIKAFLRVNEVAPNTEVATTAQYDAAALYIADSKWQPAIPILERFRLSYPGHELQPEVDKNLAAAYLKTNQPIKAAAEFQRLAVTSESAEIRREAILQASDLYADGGDQNRSIAMLEQFVQDFPSPAEPAMEAAAKLATHYEKLFGVEGAYTWHEKVVSLNPGRSGNDRTRYLAAKSSLVLVKPSVDAYQRVRLVAPLKQTLREKRELMEAALDRYAELSSYGISEISTEAAYQTGFIYADFADAIMESERPAELDADALEEYEILLEEQADPFLQKAIDAHEVNVGRINQDVYDDWVKRSLVDLQELSPGRYNKEERINAVTRIH